MAEDTLTVTDNRTGREYTLPITDGTIHATDLRQVSAEEGDGGLMSYDPAYLNTASCRSAITFIDGDRGILRYRGYPIEQLAEEATFLETAYLLLEGELPTAEQLHQFEDEVRATVRTVLNLYLSANPPGGPEQLGWPLNKRLMRKDLEAVVTRVPGVEFVESLELGVGSPVDIPDYDMTGLQLPVVVGLNVVTGVAEPLATVFGSPPPSDPTV